MTNAEPVKIGNGQAFWGDSPFGPLSLVATCPDLDYLTLDYLSEVSLSIMAVQREQDSSRGYAADFVEVIRALSPIWEQGSCLRVIANAGGLNPLGCARACQAVLEKSCRRPLKIGVVSGDDVLSQLQAANEPLAFRNLDDERPLSTIQDKLITANAYLGASAIVDALGSGADIVITGRVADPSLTVAPCIYHYGWSWEDYDKIAAATMAGHLIECGTQVTGGCSTNWLEITKARLDIPFPIAEVYADGSCVITKPEGSGGAVTRQTVTEQLLYEIGDPSNYMSPDVRLSLLEVEVTEEKPNRVRVTGARGQAPSPYLKVSATYRDGFKAEAYLTIFGPQAVLKGERCGQLLLKRLEQDGVAPERYRCECLGSGAIIPGITPAAELHECVIRLSAADLDRMKVEYFSQEVASLVTAGPQGVTGYSSGRPPVRPIFTFWPCLIASQNIYPTLTLLHARPCLKSSCAT